MDQAYFVNLVVQPFLYSPMKRLCSVCSTIEFKLRIVCGIVAMVSLDIYLTFESMHETF